jgi:15-cis-phytoene synthase
MSPNLEPPREGTSGEAPELRGPLAVGSPTGGRPAAGPTSGSPALDPHSARYFAHLYSPPLQQLILDALLGIEREVFESLRPGIDHHVAHSRLQWWREECERTASGTAVHPLTRTLVDALRPTPFALAGLSGIVDTAIWDLASATFENRRELTAYCERWAGAMIEPLMNATSRDQSVRDGKKTRGDRGSAVSGWTALGVAIREVELLNDLAPEARHGRIRVPLDELDRVKVDSGALAKPPWPNQVADILRARYSALRSEMARGVATIDRTQQPPLRGLLVWAALVWRSSQRAERALPDRLLPGRFDAISDAWFAWRVARKATLGRFSLSE